MAATCHAVRHRRCIAPKRPWRLLPIIAAMLLLEGCGGGGGGGSPVLRQPPPATRPPSPPVPTQPTPPAQLDAKEYRQTPALEQLRAATMYRAGHNGNGVTLGIVDSGVDGQHDELTGRIIGGGDWHSSNDGSTDPHGHGTHVASIAMAAADATGMMGVAYEASVVSYRILDSQGSFGSQNGNSMVPQFISNAKHRGLPLLNHSWASFYEINDFSRDEIERSMRGELDAYRGLVGDDGPVIIWAAGNGSDNQVSVRSGLPHLFAELQPHWLVVVSVDGENREPIYTNRCGVAAAWCLTAPGGGDRPAVDGVYAAASGGGYIRHSGTSMAAPAVSGSLAVVMDAFPGFTPREAAARLLATASLDGLTTATGCTLANCGNAEMQRVFGQGMVNLERALQPVGNTSVRLGSGHAASFRQSLLLASPALGPSLGQSIGGLKMVVEDSFDGAIFSTGLQSRLVAPAAERPWFAAAPPPQVVMASTADSPQLRFAATTVAPADPLLAAGLTDIPSPPTQLWYGLAGRGGDGSSWRLLTGYGPARQAGQAIYQWPLEAGMLGNIWLGGGLDQQQQAWFGSHGMAALQLGTSTSRWLFGGIGGRLGGALIPPLDWQAEMLSATGSMQENQTGLVRSAIARLEGWRASFGGRLKPSANRRAVNRPSGHRWVVMLEQPLAVSGGAVGLALPGHDANGRLAVSPHRLALQPAVREHRLGLLLSSRFGDYWQSQLGVGYASNHGGRRGVSSSRLWLGLHGRW